MKILRLLLVCVLLGGLGSVGLFAQNLKVEEIIQNRGEAVVLVKNPDQREIMELSRIASIDKFEGEDVVAYISAPQLENVKALSLDVEVYEPYYTTNRALNMASSIGEMETWDKYPTWSVFQEMMLSFAADYPDICRLDTIGFSEENRAILVVKISDNVNADEAEPEFFLSGQMHGDELISYILPLRMIEYLLAGYGSNDQIDNLVNNLEIWINPLANPDGTYGNDENDVSGATRSNANYVDLNRNFPDPNGSYTPDGNPTAAENVAMMNFAAERHFAMSANSHSGAEVLNYPWDTWEELHADDTWLVDICRKYADTVHANSFWGYMTYLDDGITNGYAWYTTDGSRQDYFNYYEHCREVTFEWSNDKLLDSDELPAHWDYNYRSMLNYFAEAMEGIHGIVTDSITGEPVAAEIFIVGHDVKNTQVYSELPNGDYHRYLAPGSWELTFSAEGYIPKTILFELSQDERIDMNVRLVHESGVPAADFNFEMERGTVSFENLSQNADEYSWSFGDGNSSVEADPVHVYEADGEYDVTLVATNDFGSDQVVKSIVIVDAAVNTSAFRLVDIYPNPANKTLTIRGMSKTIKMLSICDMSGRSIFESNVSATEIRIDVSALKSGVYQLIFIDENQNKFTKKLIINH